VPKNDKLLAHTFNLNFALSTPDAVGLDRQQLSTTWRLGDVARGRQIGAVEIADDLAALVDLAGFGQENRLLDDRSAAALRPEHDIETLQGILGLFAESAATLRDCCGKDLTDVVQLDGRKTNPPVGCPANGVRGHSEFLHVSTDGQWQETDGRNQSLLDWD